jgi:hypothetical protein
MGSKNVICWNVWGINSGAHRNMVRELVREERVSLVCLQVTKMDVIFDYDILQILGPGFEYFFLPGCHTWGEYPRSRIRVLLSPSLPYLGGILVAWRSSSWVISSTSSRHFSVSLHVWQATEGSKSGG